MESATLSLIVFTQRLKRSGMSWMIEAGQVILDLRVIGLSGVWDAVQQRYLASRPMPVSQGQMARGAQYVRKAASVFGNGAITPY